MHQQIARGLAKRTVWGSPRALSSYSSAAPSPSPTGSPSPRQRRALPTDDARSLKDFLATAPEHSVQHPEISSEMNIPAYPATTTTLDDLRRAATNAEPRTFTIESYGCQQNVADSEVVRAIMEQAHYKWVEASSGQDGHHNADVVFLNTCAIRENAEDRIWGRLNHLKHPPRRPKPTTPAPSRRQAWSPSTAPVPVYKRPVIGLLGCMAERLKTKLLEEEAVDLVVGPDAYRDLPRLLDVVEGGDKGVNVQLSMDETYSEIKPVRISPEQCSAFGKENVSPGCLSKGFCPCQQHTHASMFLFPPPHHFSHSVHHPRVQPDVCILHCAVYARPGAVPAHGHRRGGSQASVGAGCERGGAARPKRELLPR